MWMLQCSYGLCACARGGRPEDGAGTRVKEHVCGLTLVSIVSVVFGTPFSLARGTRRAVRVVTRLLLMGNATN